MSDRLNTYAKDLRSRSTDAERILWSHIRANRLNGLKFRRQHPIGKYIVDFVCLERKIVVELDGGQHTDPKMNEIRGLRGRDIEYYVSGITLFC